MMDYPKTGWRKWAFKAPLVLWRMGLSPLIGYHLLVMTVRERHSGLPNRIMLEYYRDSIGRLYIVSAFGEQAQWVKNIKEHPYVTVQTAYGIESVQIRRVTQDDELLRVVALFMTRNPILTRWYLETQGIRETQDDILAKKERLYFMTFEPTEKETPPPLQTDLVWFWGLVGALVTTWLLLRSDSDA